MHVRAGVYPLDVCLGGGEISGRRLNEARSADGVVLERVGDVACLAGGVEGVLSPDIVIIEVDLDGSLLWLVSVPGTGEL